MTDTTAGQPSNSETDLTLGADTDVDDIEQIAVAGPAQGLPEDAIVAGEHDALVPIDDARLDPVWATAGGPSPARLPVTP